MIWVLYSCILSAVLLSTVIVLATCVLSSRISQEEEGKDG